MSRKQSTSILLAISTVLFANAVQATEQEEAGESALSPPLAPPPMTPLAPALPPPAAPDAALRTNSALPPRAPALKHLLPAATTAYPAAAPSARTPILMPASSAAPVAQPSSPPGNPLDAARRLLPAAPAPGDGTPPDAPPDQGNGSAPPSGPGTTLPAISPPAVNRPPLTDPQPVSLPRRSNAPLEPALAWRAKAYKLAQEFPDNKSGDCKAWRVYSSSFDDTMQALRTACSGAGYKIEASKGDAGQIAARPIDPALAKIQIIIAVKSMSFEQTAVLLGLFPDSKAIKQDTLQDLLNRTDLTLNKKGLL
jgi:hypothetical protein